MSAQQRYRTLIQFLTQIYSATDKNASTRSMNDGLAAIMVGACPNTNAEWETMSKDVSRLLKVWLIKENDPVAQEIASQIHDMLREFTVDAPVAASPPGAFPLTVPAPTLIITDTPIPAAVDIREISIIQHVSEDGDVVASVSSAASVAEEEEAEVEEEEVEAEEEEVEAEEEEVEEEEVEEEEEEVEEEEVEEEEEVVEPEAEEEAEEEEEGMEVEQIFIRGRSYWLETNTKKLYAVVDGDDVGDEVGAMINGKPVFLSK